MKKRNHKFSKISLEELKSVSLGIDKERFGKICSFVDFGNVNYWYENDEKDAYDKNLPENSKLVVDIIKLAKFTKFFSDSNRFYFGLDDKNPKSIRIIKLARENFDQTITKPIQNIKHYLDDKEIKNTTRLIKKDKQGKLFINLPKCNFDVEICIDVIRLLDEYDTMCLFSSDADFAGLVEFLRKRRKKTILFSSGYVSGSLKKKVDLNINCQKIKGLITFKKRKSRLFRARF